MSEEQVFGSLEVDSTSKTPYTNAMQRKKFTNHIKRPSNAFMLWSKINRKNFREQRPDVENREISKWLGSRWKLLSDDERQPYIEEAKRLSTLHKQQYPDYKFMPKKKAKKLPKSIPLLKHRTQTPCTPSNANCTPSGAGSLPESRLGPVNVKLSELTALMDKYQFPNSRKQELDSLINLIKLNNVGTIIDEDESWNQIELKKLLFFDAN
ncbi:transcription factor sem-2-like [Centruroides vittatus]|uniref:transcription factor sem-2-like n=1 Tax=Centruroides vittatus TaxID=120091 RepID=UPI00350F1EE1